MPTRRAATAVSALFLAAIGAVVGAASLAYPLALDGAVNHYVAREWVLRGALPYRDVFDHRAPGIYAVHALCIRLFGENAWGIRAAELLATAGCAWLASLVVTPLRERPSPTTVAASYAASALFYYGFFDYWCTAQCEIWACLCTLAALAAARRVGRVGSAAAIVGVLLGAALLLRPPAVLLGAPALVALASRARSSRASRSSLARVALGSLALPSVTVLYFSARGGLADLRDVTFGANAYYVSHEPAHLDAARVLSELGLAWRYFAPLSTTLVVTFVLYAGLARFSGDDSARRAARDVGLSALAALVVVIVQRKFFLYHWALFVAPVALFGAALGRSELKRRAAASLAWRTPTFAAVLLFSFARSGRPFDEWRVASYEAARWEAGDVDRETYTGSLASLRRFYGHRFSYPEREAAGLWLRAHSGVDDTVLVRGMAAEVYLISGRRSPGRFFWSLFLTEPTRAYHREAWLAEDRRALDEHPPRWVVSYRTASDPLESASTYEALGYVERASFGQLVVLEGGASAIVTR